MTGRPMRRSPGRPGWHREVERRFWSAMTTGLATEDAAVACGVAPAVASRSFRQSGGMSPYRSPPPAGRYLSFAEREELALQLALGMSLRAIARALGRAPSTTVRESPSRPQQKHVTRLRLHLRGTRWYTGH